MAYSSGTLPTIQQQQQSARNVSAQNPAAPLNPTPVAPSMPAVTLPGSQPTSGVSQSQQSLARPVGANTGVPIPSAAQGNPQTVSGLANTPPQMQQSSNIQQMVQNLGAAKISQNPILMQNILAMLGPQVSAPPSLGSLMQPQPQPEPQASPTLKTGAPVGRI